MKPLKDSIITKEKMPSNKNKDKKLNLSLADRKPLAHFEPRKEKFAGPSSYDIHDDYTVKAASISHAPRFPGEKRPSRELSAQQQRKKELEKDREKRREELEKRHASLSIDALYKSVDPCVRSYSSTKGARFEWEKEEELRKLREQRAQKLIAQGVHAKNLLPNPSKDLDIERGIAATTPKVLVPVIRPETDESKELRSKSTIKPDSEEQIQSKNRAAKFKTITDLVDNMRIGSFENRSKFDTRFEPGLQLHSPGAIYEPNYDSVLPHKQVPIIAPLVGSQQHHHDETSAAAAGRRNIIERKFRHDYDKEAQEQAYRALEQAENLLPRSRHVVFDKCPISAEMPFAYNEANYCNSKSMRADLCDTEGIRMYSRASNRSSSAAAAASNRRTTPTPSSLRKRKSLPESSSGSKTPDPSVHNHHGNEEESTPNNNNNNNNNDTPSSSQRYQNHSNAFRFAFESPFCRRDPVPSVVEHRISISTPTFSFESAQEQEMNRKQREETIRALHSGSRSHSSQISMITHNSPDGRTCGVVSKQEEMFQKHWNKNHHQQQPSSSAASAGSSSPSKFLSALASPSSASPSFDDEQMEGGGEHFSRHSRVLHPTRWSVSVKKKALPDSGIPLTALLKKKKLQQNTTFKSLYKPLKGASMNRLDSLENELVVADHHHHQNNR